MDEKKVLDKEYLLKQLRKLIGKELYEDIDQTVVVAPPEASYQITDIIKTTYTYYKYTGTKNGIEVKTADQAASYTSLCGETIIIGDKVRPSIVITDKNINRYIGTITDLQVGEYIKSTSTTDYMVSNDNKSIVYIDYINGLFFKTDPAMVGDVINFVDEETETITHELERIITDIRNKKATVVDVTYTQYFRMQQAGTVEHNTFYYVTDAAIPTCWYNGINILDSGSVDTSEAQDGQFYVYSATETRPVWVTVTNLDEILF